MPESTQKNWKENIGCCVWARSDIGRIIGFALFGRWKVGKNAIGRDFKGSSMPIHSHLGHAANTHLWYANERKFILLSFAISKFPRQRRLCVVSLHASVLHSFEIRASLCASRIGNEQHPKMLAAQIDGAWIGFLCALNLGNGTSIAVPAF